MSADFQRISLDQNGHMKCTNKNAKEIADIVKILSIAQHLSEEKSLTCLDTFKKEGTFQYFICYTPNRHEDCCGHLGFLLNKYIISQIPLSHLSENE